jgi:hypothetical protein
MSRVNGFATPARIGFPVMPGGNAEHCLTQLSLGRTIGASSKKQTAALGSRGSAACISEELPPWFLPLTFKGRKRHDETIGSSAFIQPNCKEGAHRWAILSPHVPQDS